MDRISKLILSASVALLILCLYLSRHVHAQIPEPGPLLGGGSSSGGLTSTSPIIQTLLVRNGFTVTTDKLVTMNNTGVAVSVRAGVAGAVVLGISRQTVTGNGTLTADIAVMGKTTCIADANGISQAGRPVIQSLLDPTVCAELPNVAGCHTVLTADLDINQNNVIGCAATAAVAGAVFPLFLYGPQAAPRGSTIISIVGSGGTVTAGTGAQDFQGTFSSSTSGAFTVVLTFSQAAANGWSCQGNNQTTITNRVSQIASSSVSATLSLTTVSGDVVNYNCGPF